MPTLFVVILSFIACFYMRKAFLRWYIRECQQWLGLQHPNESPAYGCDFLNRFEYLHYFVIQTRLYLRFKRSYLKHDLFEFLTRYRILGFETTTLGKCVKARMDTKLEIARINGNVINKSHRFKFSNYLDSLVNFDATDFRDYVSYVQRTRSRATVDKS